MKKIILLLVLTACAFSQGPPKCSICLKVPKCPPELSTDGFVDPIYNFIVQQVAPADFPLEISKVANQAQANYTFIWKSGTYLAVVDLATKKFTVMAVQRPKQVLDTQSKLGIRENNSVSPSSSSKDLLNYIDQDLRSKFFQNQEVKLVECTAIEGGYHLVYQKADGSLSAFNVAVQNNAGNIMVTYNAVPSKKDKETSPSGGQSQTSNTQSASSVTQQANPVQTPSVGGFQTISNPTANGDVIGVLSFLINKVDSVIQSASLLKAESQLVSGNNYRLSISFDTSSPAYYVIVVYRNLAGQYSLTSIDLVNVSGSYNFQSVLTGNQISQIPYINYLQNALAQRLSNILVPGTILDKLSVNFPYYKLVYHNDAMSQINVVAFFDLLKKNLTVLESSALAYPLKQQPPAPTTQKALSQQPVSQQPAQNSQLKTQNQESKNQQQSQNQQPSPQLTQNPQQQSSNHQQKPRTQDDFEPISTDLAKEPFVQAYIQYLSSSDTRFNQNNLIGVFCKSKDRNFLSFRYRAAGNSVVSTEGSIDYIQFILSRRPAPQAFARVANCLRQNQGVCVKCQFKYYLNGGKCYEVPSQCSQFDYQRNLCQACYQGFYLDSNSVCQTANFLCMSSDKRGNCLSCYNNYRLTALGRCVYNAEGADFRIPEQVNNPLCSKFSGVRCLACVQGCYLNSAGMCKVPDPNCDKYDTENEKCLVCMQNYELKNGSSWCVRSKNY